MLTDLVLLDPEVEVLLVGADCAHGDVGMAADVFCARVYDDIGSEGERALEDGREERVVNEYDNLRVEPMHCSRHLLNVHQLGRRIRR
jgi:hypothetical protein